MASRLKQEYRWRDECFYLALADLLLLALGPLFALAEGGWTSS